MLFCTILVTFCNLEANLELTMKKHRNHKPKQHADIDNKKSTITPILHGEIKNSKIHNSDIKITDEETVKLI
jgi:hypothetical protein